MPNMTIKPRIIGFGLVAIALPCAALLYVVRAHHTPLVLSHYLHGRAGNCTVSESFEGEALSRLQAANAEELRASIKVVRQDDRYSLWSTPYGELWMPSASGDALIYDLAEQRRNIYGAVFARVTSYWMPEPTWASSLARHCGPERPR